MLLLRSYERVEGGSQKFAGKQESNGIPIALSPDGTLMAYSAVADGQAGIFFRRSGLFEPTFVKGTEGGTSPFFSFDGKWLGFYAQGGFRRASVADAVGTLGARIE